MKDVFKISSSALPETTRVAGFRGSEGISRTYELELYLLLGAEGQELDLTDAVGAKATLEIDRDDGRPPFLWHGIFAAFELVHELGDRSLFHATLVPQLWQLKQTFHSRIFTNKSIPEIIQEVLEDGGLTSRDYVFKLSQDYRPQEHVCQYQESHFDFISRWMEREGLYYYFEQGEDAEKLVITDSKSFQAPLPEKGVRFHALGGHDGSSGEALHSFTCKVQALPASVRLKDYDYTKPTLDVSGSAAVSKVGLGEISVHGSRFFTPEEGKRLARVRAEELLSRQAVYRGAGTAPYLRAGYFFKLEDHPRHGFDQEYLVVAAQHVGNQGAGDPHLRALMGLENDRVYWVETTAIPSKVQFRAESTTAWPRIFGFENGTVCGPMDSEYAQIDDHGRYNVKFKFDESDLKDGRASTWVRMLQPHGGDVEGWHFPLRKGTEVLFTFLGGDPDRPVLAGVVPNLHTPSPVTRANHTKNVIQTGGRNRLELEDRAGQQRITLSTPHSNSFVRLGAPNKGHTMIVQTDQATFLNAGTDFDMFVGQIGSAGSWDSVIKNNWTAKVQEGGWSVGVCLDEEEASPGQINFKSTSNISLETTGGNYSLDVDDGDANNSVSGLNHDHFGSWHSDVDEEWNHTSKSVTWDIEEDVEQTAKGEWKITADKVETTSKGDWKWSCLGDKVELTVDASSETTIGATNENFIGGKVELTVAASAEITLGAALEFFAGVKIEGDAGVHVELEGLHLVEKKLEIKEVPTVIKDEMIKLETKALGLIHSAIHIFT